MQWISVKDKLPEPNSYVLAIISLDEWPILFSILPLKSDAKYCLKLLIYDKDEGFCEYQDGRLDSYEDDVTYWVYADDILLLID